MPFALLVCICLVVSPILILQAKLVRKRVPSLPEAKTPTGTINVNNSAPFHLLVIGESTMAGVGIDDHNKGFAGTLAKLIAKKIKRTVYWNVHARSGFTVKQIINRLLPETNNQVLDLIVIGVGANDAFSLNLPSTFGSHVDEFITILKKQYTNTPIIFINMPPISYFPAFTKLMQFCIGHWVKNNGKQLQLIAKKYDAVYYMSEEIKPDDWFDKYDHFDTVHDMFSDGVHPSEMTYKLWAKECYQYLFEQGVLIV